MYLERLITTCRFLDLFLWLWITNFSRQQSASHPITDTTDTQATITMLTSMLSTGGSEISPARHKRRDDFYGTLL